MANLEDKLRKIAEGLNPVNEFVSQEHMDLVTEFEQTRKIPKHITHDLTIPEGDYVLAHDVEIDQNATLTLEPGARIRTNWDFGYKINANGNINAIGYENNPVIFEGNVSLYLKGSKGNLISYCSFLDNHANNLIELDGSEIIIMHSQFRNTNPQNLIEAQKSKIFLDDILIEDTDGHVNITGSEVEITDMTVHSLMRPFVFGRSDIKITGASFADTSKAMHVSDCSIDIKEVQIYSPKTDTSIIDISGSKGTLDDIHIMAGHYFGTGIRISDSDLTFKSSAFTENKARPRRTGLKPEGVWDKFWDIFREKDYHYPYLFKIDNSRIVFQDCNISNNYNDRDMLRYHNSEIYICSTYFKNNHAMMLIRPKEKGLLEVKDSVFSKNEYGSIIYCFDNDRLDEFRLIDSRFEDNNIGLGSVNVQTTKALLKGNYINDKSDMNKVLYVKASMMDHDSNHVTGGMSLNRIR